MQHFVNATAKADFQPNIKICIAIIFSVGVVASIALLLAALVAVAYLLRLTCSVLFEVASSVAHLYSTSDHAIQLLMLVIAGYFVARLARFAVRTIRR